MLIEEMTEAHLEDILAVEKLCFPNAPWSKPMFISELTNRFTRYCVVTDSGRAVAYMGMWLAADEGHISNIAVSPAYQRQGLAALLLQHFFSLAKELRLVLLTLEVRVSNEPALRLYRKFGFEQVGLRKNYYENKEDAYIMTRFLN